MQSSSQVTDSGSPVPDIPLCRLCGNDLTTHGERALEICTNCIFESHRHPSRITISSPTYGFSRHGPQKSTITELD